MFVCNTFYSVHAAVKATQTPAAAQLFKDFRLKLQGCLFGHNYCCARGKFTGTSERGGELI
jgi:hypothetical protein